MSRNGSLRIAALPCLGTYIANLSVVRTPGVYQLPLAILEIPHFHAVIRRSGDNTVAIEVKSGDGDKIPMAGVEVGKSSRYLGALHCPHWNGLGYQIDELDSWANDDLNFMHLHVWGMKQVVDVALPFLVASITGYSLTAKLSGQITMAERDKLIEYLENEDRLRVADVGFSSCCIGQFLV